MKGARSADMELASFIAEIEKVCGNRNDATHALENLMKLNQRLD